MVQRFVFVGLLVLKELVKSVGLEDPLGLVGEEDSVTIEGHAQLALRHLRHLVRCKHGGRSDTWRSGTERSHNLMLLLLLYYRSLHGQAPVYICDLLHPYMTSRSLRSSDQGLLVVPRTRLKTKGDRAFEIVAPTLWNALPLDSRSAKDSSVQTGLCLASCVCISVFYFLCFYV